jgi:hypothetical protein
MVLPFFSLPAELRNMVFEFALFSPSPLVYRYPTPRHEFGFLCPATSTTDRNDQDIELNQLKYVSRQLRTETEDLELKYNDIIFSQDCRDTGGKGIPALQRIYQRIASTLGLGVPTSNKYMYPSDEAVWFLQHFPLYKFAWLQKIIIKPLPEEASHPAALELRTALCAIEQLGFCANVANRPGLSIHYILPHLTSRHPQDTMRVIAKSLILRGGLHRLHDLNHVSLPGLFDYMNVYGKQREQRG